MDFSQAKEVSAGDKMRSDIKPSSVTAATQVTKPAHSRHICSDDDSLLQPYYVQRLAPDTVRNNSSASPTVVPSPEEPSDHSVGPFERRPRAKPRKRDADGRILPKSPQKASKRQRSKAAAVLAKKATMPGIKQPSKFVQNDRRVTVRYFGSDDELTASWRKSIPV
jgi:hypothetical protein